MNILKIKMNKKVNLFPSFCICLGILTIVIIIYYILLNNPDNDMWWMLSTGKYIIQNHTFPKINPFVIHNNLKIIIEQPLLAIINYSIYSLFGVMGFYVLSTIYYIINGILVYIWLDNYTENKITKYFSLIIYSFIICMYINTRPTIITLSIMLIELIILNKVQNDNNKKYLLLWLLLLSIIEINIHSALWWMLFIIILPYIVPNLFQKDVIPTFLHNIKLYLPIIIGMFFVGFINPYGIDNILFLFKSMNNSKVFLTISEMQNPTFIQPYGIIILTSIIIFSIYLYKCIHSKKLNITTIYMTMGLLCLSIMYYRNFYVLIIAILPIFCSFYDEYINHKILQAPERAKITIMVHPIERTFINVFFIIIIFCILFEIKNISIYPEQPEYIDVLNQYNKEDIILYNNFNEGGLLEWYGYKVYIDARPELFQKVINGKEDIADEYYNISSNLLANEQIIAFINKYQFNFLLTDRYNILYTYLSNNDRYENIYSSTDNKYNLFKLKDEKE